jgi:hypothetical protein
LIKPVFQTRPQVVALAVSSVRHLPSSEPTTRIVFYFFSTVSSLISAVPLGWRWQPPLP